jgi:hypothetical protein
VPSGSTEDTRVRFAYRTGDVINDLGRRVGELKRGLSWFVCQTRSDRQNPPVGFGPGKTALNDHWLFTVSDSLPRRWGWFPATMISGGDNFEPIPGLDICDPRKFGGGPLVGF